MANTVAINIFPGTLGQLAPGQRVTTAYRYTGTYHIDLNLVANPRGRVPRWLLRLFRRTTGPAAGTNPQVQVRLQIPQPDAGGVPYDSTQIAATFTSPPDGSGNGTWYYNSNTPVQGGATIQAWLFDGTVQVAGPNSVQSFFVRNAPPPPVAS